MEQRIATDRFHTLMSYLRYIMYQAQFYSQDHGWKVVERLSLSDLLKQRKYFENNPNFEIIFGEGAYDTLGILAHCERFFQERGYSRQIFFHMEDPNTERDIFHAAHLLCECAVIVMGDEDTQTLCTVTRMNQSGIFYIVTKTSEKE